jgi:hypothetical protein
MIPPPHSALSLRPFLPVCLVPLLLLESCCACATPLTVVSLCSFSFLQSHQRRSRARAQLRTQRQEVHVKHTPFLVRSPPLPSPPSSLPPSLCVLPLLDWLAKRPPQRPTASQPATPGTQGEATQRAAGKPDGPEPPQHVGVVSVVLDVRQGRCTVRLQACGWF